jgi:hypothetical protein
MIQNITEEIKKKMKIRFLESNEIINTSSVLKSSEIGHKRIDHRINGGSSLF